MATVATRVLAKPNHKCTASIEVRKVFGILDCQGTVCYRLLALAFTCSIHSMKFRQESIYEIHVLTQSAVLDLCALSAQLRRHIYLRTVALLIY